MANRNEATAEKGMVNAMGWAMEVPTKGENFCFAVEATHCLILITRQSNPEGYPN